MLEIIQPGIAGKTPLMLEMHRFRKRVFNDRLRWCLRETPGGLEVDDFDLPDTPYLLALDDVQSVVGCWRMTASTSPTMIETLWPQFLQTIELPKNSRVWEVSRFAVDVMCSDPVARKTQTARALRELLQGLMEVALLCGIEHIFTLYNDHVAAMLARLGYLPACTSEDLPLGEELCRVARFDASQAALDDLRKNFGTVTALVTADRLPPTLADFRILNQSATEQEYV